MSETPEPMPEAATDPTPEHCGHPANQTAFAGGLLICHACAQTIGRSPRETS